MIGIRDRSKGHFKNGNKDFRGDFWFFFFLFEIFSFSGIISVLHETFFFEGGVAPHGMRNFLGGTSGRVCLWTYVTPVRSLCWEDSPGGGNGNPLQYSCLENPVDIGACQFTVRGVAKSQTWLSDWACTSMQVHSSLTKDGTQAPCSGSAET